MSTAGVAYQVLDGRAAVGKAEDMLALAHEVDAGAGEELDRQFRVWCRQPGFVLAEARHGGFLVGYGCGTPLRPSTSWWRGLTTPLPAEFTTEHQGRTFALTQLLVRAAWRRQGIATELYRLVMVGRPEERGTLTVPPGAAAAQSAFRAWGWHKVARTQGEDPESAVLDVLVTSLPVSLPGS
ncbi:GNAT family N-acetyltransferase [Trebonia kvetii]|uniref:GNAT family N-acetyltransferase n=1 Tax=Trebonia kvetii TaxID=2480626 RepID=A0A6P2C6C9_9ACTN|nr:GNAT family N-acetyltransferase [Trebonia kvetii]TVZ06989.1 GNAT family N-acetyltransferase [Trebonia kvetii]